MAASALRPVARLVRSSHERFDGGGYPDGLKGEEIPQFDAEVVEAFIATLTEPSIDAEHGELALAPR
jgi:HD domain